MRNVFRPNYVYKRLQDIDLQSLKDKGVRTIILDIDNTLVPYYEASPTLEAKDFISLLKREGFYVILASNNTEKRVSLFAKDLDVVYYYSCYKPLPMIYHRIARNESIDLASSCAIGDQILTDVLGANCCGLHSIYVEPIIEKDSITTIINRRIEKVIRKILKI